MTVSYKVGDLFDPAFKFDAIGHGVNCKGVMGSGIAVAFKANYPAMYRQYQHLCMSGGLTLGQVFAWQVGNYAGESDYPQEYVYNIASQFHPGKDGKLEAIKVAMHWVDFHARHHGVATVGLPRIGCGIAGLDFIDVCATIEEVVGSSKVAYTIVSLPEA